MAKEKISYDISVPRFLDFLNVISASYGVGTIVYHILGFSFRIGAQKKFFLRLFTSS